MSPSRLAPAPLLINRGKCGTPPRYVHPSLVLTILELKSKAPCIPITGLRSNRTTGLCEYTLKPVTRQTSVKGTEE